VNKWHYIIYLIALSIPAKAQELRAGSLEVSKPSDSTAFSLELTLMNKFDRKLSYAVAELVTDSAVISTGTTNYDGIAYFSLDIAKNTVLNLRLSYVGCKDTLIQDVQHLSSLAIFMNCQDIPIVEEIRY